MHVWPTFVQLNVFGEFCTIFWTYLLKMCKKRIQIDALDSCLGEEDADARFGTLVTHSKQDTRYNASLVFFGWREQEDQAWFLFLFYFIVLVSLLILILKIRIKDTMKTYFCYCHKLL